MALNKTRIVRILNGRGQVANQIKSLDALASTLKDTADRAAHLQGYHTLYRAVMAQAHWVPVNNDVKYVMHTPQVHGQPTDYPHNVHTFFYARLWKQ